jgi:hypothetical protein
LETWQPGSTWPHLAQFFLQATVRGLVEDFGVKWKPEDNSLRSSAEGNPSQIADVGRFLIF